jgi:hypothetical protein
VLAWTAGRPRRKDPEQQQSHQYRDKQGGHVRSAQARQAITSSGTAVAAHGIDGYPGHYGAGVVSGSTSQPRYVLQFGQTWCGRFGCPQTVQTFTRGASRRCVARRLSRRDFDVFFFGTAMSGPHGS